MHWKTTCELCGGAELMPTRYVDVFGMGASLVRCAACGFKFYDRRLRDPQEQYNSPAAVALAEDEARSMRLGGGCASDRDENLASYRRYYGPMISAVRRHAGIVRTAYEVGPGFGVMMRMLREAGVDVSGCDLCGRSAELAASFSGAPIEHAAVADARIPSGVDMAIMLDVIEHTETPRRDLEAVARAVRPGGVLLLKTFYDEFHDRKELDLTPYGNTHRSVDRTGHFCPLSHVAHFDRRVLLDLVGRWFDVVETVDEQRWGQIIIYARRRQGGVD